VSIDDDIVAVGGELTPERVLSAYQQGIFPWPHEGYPLLWFCPDPRFVLPLDQVHIGRSLRKTIQKGRYVIQFDTAFREVMLACATRERSHQDGTWINDDMIDVYTQLHEQGYAHSVEAYLNGKLVGGLYGISLGGIFFGESMFSMEADASKIAFATLLAQLAEWDFDLVDCQQETEHLARFGAMHWPRERFLQLLQHSLEKPTRQGKWTR
jgi:leucyl/phenylalanyl-tRNA--protein transferase